MKSGKRKPDVKRHGASTDEFRAHVDGCPDCAATPFWFCETGMRILRVLAKVDKGVAVAAVGDEKDKGLVRMYVRATANRERVRVRVTYDGVHYKEVMANGR